jgi:peroxiredoxin
VLSRKAVKKRESGRISRRRNAGLKQAGGGRCLLLGLTLTCLVFSVFPAFGTDIPTPFEADRLVGRPAPDFSLKALDGRRVSLSGLKGTLVLLHFWGAWSPPSKDELPRLEALYRLVKTRGLEVLAVSTDASPDRVEAFLREKPVSFPVVFDGGRTLSRGSYKVFVVPTTFVIGRNGAILRIYYGGQRWDSQVLLKEIEAYL